MNYLNNQQVVLLTILVSFVTSIATGIFTVSLLDQAPPAVTNTLSRVVERTVEVVTPTEKETIVLEKIVVDRNGEVIVSAIEKTAGALVLLGTKDDKGGTATSTFTKINTGFFVTEDGAILSLAEKLPKDKFIFGKTMTGEVIELSIRAHSEENNLALLIPTKKRKTTYIPISKNPIATGQTVIVLDQKEVAVTFISQILDGTTENPAYKIYFESNGDIVGRPIIDVEGGVVGILSEGNFVISVDKIYAFFDELERSDTTIKIPVLREGAPTGV